MAISIKRNVNLSASGRGIAEQILKKAESYAKARYVNVGINDNEGIKKYGEGETNVATVAQYLEYGWVQTVTKRQSGWFAREPRHLGVPPGTVLFMPPRPFLRATLRHKADDWVNVFKNAFVQYNGDLELALSAVGMRAKEDIQNTIRTAQVDGEVFPRRSPLTMKLYEIYNQDHETDGTGNRSGDKPLMDTGLLLSSISYQLVK